MSDKEKKIMEIFGRLIPGLTEMEKERLLAFGEGLAFKADQLKPLADQLTQLAGPKGA